MPRHRKKTVAKIIEKSPSELGTVTIQPKRNELLNQWQNEFEKCLQRKRDDSNIQPAVDIETKRNKSKAISKQVRTVKRVKKSETVRKSDQPVDIENSIDTHLLQTELEYARQIKTEPVRDGRDPTRQEYVQEFSIHWLDGQEPDGGEERAKIESTSAIGRKRKC